MADFDLAIIGGGINGAGIARDAAGRGLATLLVEQGDLASATSSASSKLITVLADTAIRGKDLDEAKASEALKRAEEARRSAKDKQEIAAVEGELAMLAAQLQAIRKLRKK